MSDHAHCHEKCETHVTACENEISFRSAAFHLNILSCHEGNESHNIRPMQLFRAGGRIGKRAFDTRHVFVSGLIASASRFPVLSIPRRYKSSSNVPLNPSPCTPHSLNNSRSSPSDSSDISHISKRLKKDQKHVAYIALGSNLGDRVDWIEKACNMMQKKGVEIKRTSGLWETEPMYVEDQNLFLNGAAEVSSAPEPLLSAPGPDP